MQTQWLPSKHYVLCDILQCDHVYTVGSAYMDTQGADQNGMPGSGKNPPYIDTLCTITCKHSTVYTVIIEHNSATLPNSPSMQLSCFSYAQHMGSSKSSDIVPHLKNNFSVRTAGWGSQQVNHERSSG